MTREIFLDDCDCSNSDYGPCLVVKNIFFPNTLNKSYSALVSCVCYFYLENDIQFVGETEPTRFLFRLQFEMLPFHPPWMFYCTKKDDQSIKPRLTHVYHSLAGCGHVDANQMCTPVCLRMWMLTTYTAFSRLCIHSFSWMHVCVCAAFNEIH